MNALVQHVDRLLQQVRAEGSPNVAAVAERRRAALHEPLRLAIVGRVKAGKSTLVNALIGRQVAPTRAGECTRVVTWFQYGSPDGTAVVQCHDGRELPLHLVDGRLPEDLPVPAEEVRRLVVSLQSTPLRTLTLIDTPGLSSLTAANEQSTRAALLGGGPAGGPGGGAGPRAAEGTSGGAGPRAAEGTAESLVSQHASGDADAVIFLFRHEQRQDEVDFLRQFQVASGEMNGSAVNALGVLSQADLLADPEDGEDPMAPAVEQAIRLACSRVAEVGDVVAVSGLMAESARTGRIRERDVIDVSSLVDVASVRLRTGVGLGDRLDPDRLRDLYAKLGPLGVVAGRHHARHGSAPFIDWLAQTSGVAVLEQMIAEHMTSRAAGLKAIRAIEAVERSARYTGHDQRVLDLVEQARMSPELHLVRELNAIAMLRSTRVATDLIHELERLSGSEDVREQLGMPAGATSAEVAIEARRRSAACQVRSSMAFAPGEAEAARVLAQSYHQIARSAETAAVQ